MTRTDRYLYSVVATCQKLHESNCGSGDRMSDENQKAAVEWLRYRAESWDDDANPHWSLYENAVYGLVMATLAESSR